MYLRNICAHLDNYVLIISVYVHIYIYIYLCGQVQCYSLCIYVHSCMANILCTIGSNSSGSEGSNIGIIGGIIGGIVAIFVVIIIVIVIYIVACHRRKGIIAKQNGQSFAVHKIFLFFIMCTDATTYKKGVFQRYQ